MINDDEKEYCPSCEREITGDNRLIFDKCPYALEMCSCEEERDEEQEFWMCDKCYTNRAMDI